MINISIKKPKPVLVMVHNASKGLRGVGLSGVTLDKNGNLIFTMSDGTVKTIKGYSQNLINTTNAVNKIKEEVSTMANNAADSAKKAKETADSIKQEYDRVEGATNSGLALIERSVLYGINRVKEATKTCKSDALANIELAHKDAIDDIAIRRLEALQDISKTLGGKLAYFNEVSVDNDTLTFRRGSGDTHRLTIDYVQHAHNASSATKLETARTINIQDASGQNTGMAANFDGSKNVTLKLPTSVTFGGTIKSGGLITASPEATLLTIQGSYKWTEGGHLLLKGLSNESDPGAFSLRTATVDNKHYTLTGKTNGVLSWDGIIYSTLQGNATSATKLQTARTINVTDADGTNTGTGASFNGTANATVKLPATIKANLTGNAATATKLANARTINVQDASASNTGTGASFDGSGNATIKLPANIKATLNGNADTATKTTATSTADKSVLELVKGITNNDWGAIRAGSTAKDAGYLEISTGDGGSEPIYARQISTASGKEVVTHEAALLDASGNTKFPGTVTAASFSGNASSATQLKTARTINVTDADGTNTGTGASFNGTNNATIKLPQNIRLYGLAFPNVDYEIRPTGSDGHKTFSILAHTDGFHYSRIQLSPKINGDGSGYIHIVSDNGKDSSQLLLTPTGASYNKTLKTTIDGNASSATKLANARTINVQDASASNTGTGASFDGSGNATIKLPAKIKATLTGNADTATKATNDGNGNNIASTYLPLSGGTLTGVVNGVTPPNGDNSKKLATTEFVNAKAKNYLPLSGGTINGDLSFTGGSRKITFNNGKSHVVGFGNGVYMYGDTADMQSCFVAFTNENGSGFQINAGDGTTQSRLVGKPDGTLTWNSQLLLPVGIVQAFAGSTIPTGWLLCDGSAVSRTNYAALFAVIGTTYGAGNGSTTFNLPNLVDKFVEGSATAGTVKSAGLPNITGAISHFEKFIGGSQVLPVKSPYGALTNRGHADDRFEVSQGGTDNNGGSGFDLGISFDASLSNRIYGKSTTVQPPALTMRYIIKY